MKTIPGNTDSENKLAGPAIPLLQGDPQMLESIERQQAVIKTS